MKIKDVDKWPIKIIHLLNNAQFTIEMARGIYLFKKAREVFQISNKTI